MADANKTASIAERKLAAEAEAVLEQMYGYFTREDRVRQVISDLDARRAA